MYIRLLRGRQRHPGGLGSPGDMFEYPDWQAQRLIMRGRAEKVERPAPKPKAKVESATAPPKAERATVPLADLPSSAPKVEPKTEPVKDEVKAEDVKPPAKKKAAKKKATGWEADHGNHG